MIEMQHLVYQIPLFSGKKCSLHSDIYYNDAYPACLLVQSGAHTYKVRFPGVLNKNSVQGEKRALDMLAKYGVTGVPKIAEAGIVGGIPYLVEYYIEGSSLDKIHHTLSCEDWKHIAHGLARFLQELTVIQSVRSFVFNRAESNYYNYGEVIKESILRHLDRHTSSGVISLHMADRIRKAIEDIDSIFQTGATFLHFDIKPQNIIFDTQSKRVAFIDYEHSRMGDYTHELFRIDMSAMKNPYFNECWQLAKQEFLAKRFNHTLKEEYSRKLFYYGLFYDISEMTYSVLIGDRIRVSSHLRGIEDKLQRL